MAVHPVHEALTTDYVKQLLKIKARQLLRRPEFRGAESLDVQQELSVHVLTQAHHFDPARGATVTFIARVVDSAAALMCRERSCLKRGAALRIQSLEAPLPFDGRTQSLRDLLTEDDGGRVTGAAVAAPSGRREALMDLSSAVVAMTPEQQKVALLLMQGGGETSISRDTGMSRRQVRAAMAAIRDHLEQAGLRDF